MDVYNFCRVSKLAAELQMLNLPYRSPPLAVPLPLRYNRRRRWVCVRELRDLFSRDNIQLGEGIATLDTRGYPLAIGRWSEIFILLFASLSFQRSIWPTGFPIWDYTEHLLIRNFISTHWLGPAKVARILSFAIHTVSRHEIACHGIEACASFLEATNPMDNSPRVQLPSQCLDGRIQDKTDISLREIVDQLQPEKWKSLLHLIDTYKDVELQDTFFDGVY